MSEEAAAGLRSDGQTACDTSGNPPTCAKAKSAFPVVAVTGLQAMSATALCFCWQITCVWWEVNCDTLVMSQFIPGPTCPTTRPAGEPVVSGPLSASGDLLASFTGGCGQWAMTERESADPCKPNPRTLFFHYDPSYTTTSGDLVAEVKKVCPAWYAAPKDTASAPKDTASAPKDTRYFVRLTVTMPYSKVR